jgi:hypothetical protein
MGKLVKKTMVAIWRNSFVTYVTLTFVQDVGMIIQQTRNLLTTSSTICAQLIGGK